MKKQKKKQKKLNRYFVDISSIEIFAKDSNEALGKALDMYEDGTALLDAIEITNVERW